MEVEATMAMAIELAALLAAADRMQSAEFLRTKEAWRGRGWVNGQKNVHRFSC
jgi:hypothetical protein